MNKPNLVKEAITGLDMSDVILVTVPDPVTLYYVQMSLSKALVEHSIKHPGIKIGLYHTIIWNPDMMSAILTGSLNITYKKAIITCLESDSYLVKDKVSLFDVEEQSRVFELTLPSYENIDLSYVNIEESYTSMSNASAHPDVKNLDEEVSEPNIQVLDNWRLIPPNENDFTSVMSAINDAIARYKGRPIIVSDFYLKAYVNVATSLVDMYNPKTKTLNTDDLSVRRLIDIISDFCNLVAFDMSIFPEFIGSWENVLRSFTKIINDRYFMCNTTFEMLYRTIENSNNKERENHE